MNIAVGPAFYARTVRAACLPHGWCAHFGCGLAVGCHPVAGVEVVRIVAFAAVEPVEAIRVARVQDVVAPLTEDAVARADDGPELDVASSSLP